MLCQGWQQLYLYGQAPYVAVSDQPALHSSICKWYSVPAQMKWHWQLDILAKFATPNMLAMLQLEAARRALRKAVSKSHSGTRGPERFRMAVLTSCLNHGLRLVSPGMSVSRCYLYCAGSAYWIECSQSDLPNTLLLPHWLRTPALGCIILIQAI